MEEIRDLIQGVATVIDDEIEDKDSQISKLISNLESVHIPVIKFNSIPNLSFIESFKHISFIIVDWKFNKENTTTFTGEGINRATAGTESLENNEKIVIEFIQEILKQTFIPIFLFSGENTENIKTSLKEKLLANDLKRVFVESKNEIDDIHKLYTAIQKWLKIMPSAYVLKVWDNKFSKAKNQMFLDLYNVSPSWAPIYRNMLKKDSGNSNAHDFELGNFITKNCVN